MKEGLNLSIKYFIKLSRKSCNTELQDVGNIYVVPQNVKKMWLLLKNKKIVTLIPQWKDCELSDRNTACIQGQRHLISRQNCFDFNCKRYELLRHYSLSKLF